MNISMAIALSLTTTHTSRVNSSAPKDISLYTGISERLLVWRQKMSLSSSATVSSLPMDVNIRRWDGVARMSTEWDGLRRDPELWFPNGDCLVYLYARGQSQRGPAFQVSFDALLAAKCRPFIEKFLVRNSEDFPVSEPSSTTKQNIFRQSTNSGKFELHIPPPPDVEQRDVFLCHLATRNFFAWIFGKPLVGRHLGGALVGLLYSMDEWRIPTEDNVQDIMNYMDEEGYADFRSSPDHALAILYFAEHFRFADLWIDAFAHCTGMNEELIYSPGFQAISRVSRALISRSKMEMDSRLENCGKRLSLFLQDDLSDEHLGLSSGAQSHLDHFRSFLRSYYAATFGCYPPIPPTGKGMAFSKSIYAYMCSEFEQLYAFLVDSRITSSDSSPSSAQGGVCILENISTFDKRHKYPSLLHHSPLLPDLQDTASERRLSKRLSWVAFPTKADKSKPEPRLVAFSALFRATNRDPELYDCSLVRAYRGFEKDYIFSTVEADKSEKISHADARKVRWLAIYAILQTLISATKIPNHVHDNENVPYNLCVSIAGCPPWKTKKNTPSSSTELKPDIDYYAINHHSGATRSRQSSEASSTLLKKGMVRRALQTLGNMPELHHPRPQRTRYHEILVHADGSSINERIGFSPATSIVEEEDSGSSTAGEGISSSWSTSDDESSSVSSVYSSRRGSEGGESVRTINNLWTLLKPPSSQPSGDCGDSFWQPEPSQVVKSP